MGTNASYGDYDPLYGILNPIYPTSWLTCYYWFESLIIIVF